MPTEIVLLSMMLALVEVAGLMLLARGAMWLFGPKARKGNFVYDIFTIGAMPFIRLTRRITPRIVHDAYIPAIAFFLLLWAWGGLGWGKNPFWAARGGWGGGEAPLLSKGPLLRHLKSARGGGEAPEFPKIPRKNPPRRLSGSHGAR